VRCVEHERHPMSEPKNQELPPHGVNTSWNDGFQGEELQQKILEARERQLSAALAEIGELKETVKHFESAPFFTRNLLANDGQMEGKDYAALTDADFKTLFEYSATCKCQGCAEIGYIITLRAERDRMAEALRKTEMRLRYIMWMRHGHSGVYGDDGEMQCGDCAKFGCWDYKNAPMEEVSRAYELALMEKSDVARAALKEGV
jgi:hypothetical protein